MSKEDPPEWSEDEEDEEEEDMDTYGNADDAIQAITGGGEKEIMSDNNIYSKKETLTDIKKELIADTTANIKKCESKISKIINEQGLYGKYPDEINEQIKALNSVITNFEFVISECLNLETDEGGKCRLN